MSRYGIWEVAMAKKPMKKAGKTSRLSQLVKKREGQKQAERTKAFTGKRGKMDKSI